MTESEWSSGADPLEMLRFLGDRSSCRKRQLFALACYEHAIGLQDEWGRRGLEALQQAPEDEEWLGEEMPYDEPWSDVDNALVSRFWQRGVEEGVICRDEDVWSAMAMGTEANLTDWSDEGAVIAGATMLVTSEAVNDGYVRALYGIHPFLRASEVAARLAANARAAGPESLRVLEARLRLFADFLRDVFGDPFRQDGSVDRGWLTPTVQSIARSAYDERLAEGSLDNGLLGVLADALEDAGCRDRAYLDHLRWPGPHIRSCHILDRLLGKS
jgi:hypothetical protein